MPFFSVLFIILGLLGPIAWLMWRRGRWLDAARWIRENIAPPAVLGTPVAGLLIIFAGLMLIWPPAVLPAFVAGAALVVVMVSAA